MFEVFWLIVFLTNVFSLFWIILLVLFDKILFTINGWYKYPPLTMDETAVTCWIGVTDTPWPNAVVASSRSPTLSRLNIIPFPSPDKSMFVFSPNPNRSKYENKRSLPSFNPSCTNPGFSGAGFLAKKINSTYYLIFK